MSYSVATQLTVSASPQFGSTFPGTDFASTFTQDRNYTVVDTGLREFTSAAAVSVFPAGMTEAHLLVVRSQGSTGLQIGLEFNGTGTPQLYYVDDLLVLSLASAKVTDITVTGSGTVELLIAGA